MNEEMNNMWLTLLLRVIFSRTKRKNALLTWSLVIILFLGCFLVKHIKELKFTLVVISR